MRIFTICVFAYLLLRQVKVWTTKDLFQVGVLWLTLTLVFEWVGSIAMGRSIEDILVGWNVFNGHMWPYVLLTYFSSNLVIGYFIRMGEKQTKDKKFTTG